MAVVTILFPPLMPQTVTRMFSLWSQKPQQTVAGSVEQVCCAYHLLGEPCAGNISASVSSHIRGTEPFTVRFFLTYAFSCMTPYVVMTHSLGSFAREQLWSDRPPLSLTGHMTEPELRDCQAKTDLSEHSVRTLQMCVGAGRTTAWN